MKRAFAYLMAVLATACLTVAPTVPTQPVKPPVVTPPSTAMAFDLVVCETAPADNYCPGPNAAQITVTPIGVTASPRVQLTDANGYAWVAAIPSTWINVKIDIAAQGFDPFPTVTTTTTALLAANAAGDHNFFLLHASFPAPPTRAQILAAHESFQGAVLHTSQFGDLFWWPTAWVSLNAADRAASYAQIASWGDTDITVSATWDYGEAGQPYGSGQLVPPLNYFPDGTGAGVPAFRASVKDVIQHTAANGQPFVPRIFMSGDNGYSYYMWAMPLIINALKPQTNDPVDLTSYVKLQMCYDSCVPGWQPPSQIDEGILATRAACPNCVIAIEFGTGYPCWGGGDGCGEVNFNSPGGQALDEVDWEGNSWPPTNWDQYWQVLARLLGPAYVRPASQPAGDDPPPVDWYTAKGTPRGPWGIQCLEPYTYQWVRGQVPVAQVAVAYQTLTAMGCLADSPPSWPR